MSGRLDGKVVIITGTGGSMGRAAVLRFAAEGAKVVGADVNAGRGQETLDLVCAAGGEMVSLHLCDLGHEPGAAALTQLALDSYGAINVLYNNAAMAYFAWVADMTFAQYADKMREEVDIIFHLTKHCWPHLIASGKGSIVQHRLGRGGDGDARTGCTGALRRQGRGGVDDASVCGRGRPA